MTFRPERKFRLGTMRHRITVSVEGTTQDGAGQPVVTLSTWLVDEPAKYEPTTGGEGARGRQVEAGISAIFTVRYRSGYTPKMAIDIDGQRFWIVYVKPVQGMDRYRELYCKSVVL